MKKLLSPGIFRFFLALTVVLHHLWVISLGAWAVYVFFILSGYWIAEVWVNKYSQQPHPYLHFISNRYARLAPVYLVCFFIAAAVLHFSTTDYPGLLEHLRDPVWWIKLATIILAATHATYLPPLWSIVVEMQFYLLAPLLVWLAARLNSAGQPSSFLMPRTAALIAVVSLLVFSLHTFLESRGTLLSSYIFCFILGILTSTSGYKPGRKLALASIGIILLTALLSLIRSDLRLLFGPDAARTSNEYWHLMNSYACAVLALVAIPYMAYSVRLPSSGWDRELGNLSYPLYMFHFSVIFLFENVSRLASLPFVPRTLMALTVIAIGTLAVYWLIDRPAEKWRRKHLGGV